MTPIFEEVDCAVCNSTKKGLISEEGQHKIPISLVLCKDCGLGYLSPRWNEATYIHFYTTKYDDYYRPSLISEINTSVPNENAIISRLKENNLLNSYPTNILDIGSGAGENLLNFQKTFPKSQLFAIEPSKASQGFLESNNINVISGDANSDWDVTDSKKYSIIILRHVLEHFLKPEEVLRKVENRLSDDGIVYIAVPNNFKPTKNIKYKWFRVVHTYYFNKISLKNILHKSNLKPLIMKEGDHRNQHELYTVATKSKEKLTIEICEKNYFQQRDIFNNNIVADQKLINVIKFHVNKFLNKFI